MAKLRVNRRLPISRRMLLSNPNPVKPRTPVSQRPPFTLGNLCTRKRWHIYFVTFFFIFVIVFIFCLCMHIVSTILVPVSGCHPFVVYNWLVCILHSGLKRVFYYRAKPSGAWYCQGKLSVCPSVTLRYCDHTGWNSAKIISRLISLTFSLSADRCL